MGKVPSDTRQVASQWVKMTAWSTNPEGLRTFISRHKIPVKE